MEGNKLNTLSGIKKNSEGKKTIVEMDDIDLERLKNYELLAEFFTGTFSAVNFQVNSNHGIWKDKDLINEIYNKAKEVNTQILMKFLGQQQ